MAESVQRIIVRRALAGQRPKDAQQVIEWLEQTVAGWNQKPTPFVWNGKRRRRRERARLRRLGGSGAAFLNASYLPDDPLAFSDKFLIIEESKRSLFERESHLQKKELPSVSLLE